jgi:hypothetical protein
MTYFRRALLIGLASLALALVGLQLGRTPWADGIRARTERYIREHPRPVETAKPAANANRPRRRSPVRQYLAPFVGTALLVGLPAGVTFLVMRKVGRRGKRAG